VTRDERGVVVVELVVTIVATSTRAARGRHDDAVGVGREELDPAVALAAVALPVGVPTTHRRISHASHPPEPRSVPASVRTGGAR
jgi:hypothetical protein